MWVWGMAIKGVEDGDRVGEGGGRRCLLIGKL